MDSPVLTLLKKDTVHAHDNMTRPLCLYWHLTQPYFSQTRNHQRDIPGHFEQIWCKVELLSGENEVLGDQQSGALVTAGRFGIQASLAISSFVICSKCVSLRWKEQLGARQSLSRRDNETNFLWVTSSGVFHLIISAVWFGLGWYFFYFKQPHNMVTLPLLWNMLCTKKWKITRLIKCFQNLFHITCELGLKKLCPRGSVSH